MLILEKKISYQLKNLEKEQSKPKDNGGKIKITKTDEVEHKNRGWPTSKVHSVKRIMNQKDWKKWNCTNNVKDVHGSLITHAHDGN